MARYADDRWSIFRTGWLPREGRRSLDRSKPRWVDDIQKIVGKTGLTREQGPAVAVVSEWLITDFIMVKNLSF